MNVIYTGLYMHNWGYYRPPQLWPQITFDRLLEYANHIKCDVQFFDNSCVPVKSLVHTFKRDIPLISQWSIGTMLSKIALKSFTQSKYDLMAWVDADILIQNFDYNIFNEFKGNTLIDHGPRDYSEFQLSKNDFVGGYCSIDYRLSSNTGLYVINQDIAKDYLEFSKEFRCNIFYLRDRKLISDYYTSIRKPPTFTDEGLTDAYLNYVQKADLPQYKTQYVTIKPDIDKSAFALHFQGNAKKFLLET